MVSYRVALKLLIDSSASINDMDSIQIVNSIGRFLAEDYSSDIDMPPFNRSAMDGYAVSDGGFDSYIIKGLIRAGDNGIYRVSGNESYAIMTGARVPQGTNRVIMKEDVQVDGENFKVITRLKGEDNSRKNNCCTNICYTGEDVTKGSTLLRRGDFITPFEVAILSSLGVNQVSVCRKIRVRLIVTGDELIVSDNSSNQTGHSSDSFVKVNEPSEVVCSIRDVNTPALIAAISLSPFLELSGSEVVKDNLGVISDALSDFLASDDDIVIITGGSSKGEYDFTQSAMDNNGVDTLFNEVNIKPGKPVIFGKKNNKSVFGLPGNPVSALITYKIFCLPYFYKISGAVYREELLECVLEHDIVFSKSSIDRKRFIPVELVNVRIQDCSDSSRFDKGDLKDTTTEEPWGCREIKYNGSGHITSLRGIRYFASIEPGVEKMSAGDRVVIRQIW